MRSYDARRLLERTFHVRESFIGQGARHFVERCTVCTCLVSIRSSSGSGQVVCIYCRFSSSPRTRLSHRSESSSGFELFPFLSRRHSARSDRTTAPSVLITLSNQPRRVSSSIEIASLNWLTTRDWIYQLEIVSVHSGVEKDCWVRWDAVDVVVWTNRTRIFSHFHFLRFIEKRVVLLKIKGKGGYCI